MSFTEQLEKMFVAENEIPDAFALSTEVHQREYLSNGEMKPWEGKVHEVYSPICIRTANGLQRKLIGTYPVCTEKEAFEALDAAVAAYDNGRGQWPTMGVADRIQCIEKFIVKMREQKDIVVKLIMWEIGKSYADSVKEFDRTVEYIYATIDALKDIDRDSSRFTIEHGFVQQFPVQIGRAHV